MMSKNRRILLVSRPTGFPKLENFKIVETEIPTISDEEILLRSLYISIDPYMRERMMDTKTYADPYPLNEAFVGDVVCEVVKSNDKNYQVGSIVKGRFGWEDYPVAKN